MQPLSPGPDAVPDDDPEVIAGMERLRVLREAEEDVAEIGQASAPRST